MFGEPVSQKEVQHVQHAHWLVCTLLQCTRLAQQGPASQTAELLWHRRLSGVQLKVNAQLSG